MAVACQFKDQRGVPRGSCRECDCHLFQRGQHQACARCNHPPAKHEKMLAQSKVSPSPLRYSEVVSSASSRVSTGDDARPKCSNCEKPVFYDKNVGFFIYCSPECRDEHALPEYDKKLKQDISEIRIPYPQKINVTIETKPKDLTGFLFIEDQDKKKVAIIGATTPNAIHFFQRELVNVHDMVIEVNGTHIKEVVEIDTIVAPRTRVELVIMRDPTFNIKLGLLFEKRHCSFKKITLLKKSYNEFGIEVKGGNKLLVKNESLAYCSGLRDNDEVKFIAEATNTEIYKVHDKSFSQLLQKKDHIYNLIIVVN